MFGPLIDAPPQDGVPIPVVAAGGPGPPELVDVIKCQCRAEGKKCSTVSCSCHKEHLTCTSYCNCCGEEGCYNPYSKRVTTKEADQEIEEVDEQDYEDVEGVEDIEEQDEEDEDDFETKYFS